MNWKGQALEPIDAGFSKFLLTEKAVNAGIDQFDRVTDSEILANAVKKGLIGEQRIDASVRRILEQQFALGLFEQPYTDVAQADRVVGSQEAQQEANQAQRD